MNTVLVKDLYTDFTPYIDKEITVAGWIRSIRASSNFGFMVINDGTHFNTLQIVLDAEMEGYKELTKLNVGAAIIAKGKLVATPDAKQDFELQAVGVEIEGESDPD
jgi:asparaginyl-tRNA synthetase